MRRQGATADRLILQSLPAWFSRFPPLFPCPDRTPAEVAGGGVLENLRSAQVKPGGVPPRPCHLRSETVVKTPGAVEP